MTPDDEAKTLALMRAARKRARGYVGLFGWAINRDRHLDSRTKSGRLGLEQ